MLVAALACACGGCGRSGDAPIRAIDLVHEFPRAERRPPTARFELAEHTLSGTRHATIAAAAPHRIIWTTNFPARSILSIHIAAIATPPAEAPGTITFRVGISDGRIYEPLAAQPLAAARVAEAGWTAMSADLSLYGGRQWSLFYRPDRRPWSLVLNADQTAGSGLALWGAPAVYTDRRAARDFRGRAATP